MFIESSAILGGSPSRQSVEQFREARLVRITDGGFAHLAGSIRDVECVGRRESVAEARCRCGFGETWQLADPECSSGLSSSVATAFKWRWLAPWWNRFLRIVVRVASPWCVVHRDTEP